MSDARAGATGRRRPLPSTVFLGVLVLVMLVLPLYVGPFWLQAGLFAMAAVVGAIGLNLLVGTAGQLSLAHAFFLAVGAYSYSFFAGTPGPTGGGITVRGLGWPPVVALLLAMAVAGLAGLLFSPIAARLRGIYLGVASLSLVFIGQHLLFNVTTVTGGFYGRNTPLFSLFGFTFGNDDPPLFVLNVPYGERERLWYLFLGCTVVAYVFARNLLKSRPGRALQTVRDREVAASVMGVPVQRYKAGAFVLSSMYAGLAGVLIALAFKRVVPDYFDLGLSISYLAMIVIGGLGAVGGGAAGAVFVSALPLVLTHYSDRLSFLAQPGSGGVDPSVAAEFIYGALVILVILVQPEGLAGVGRRLRPGRRRRGRTGAADPQPDPLSEPVHRDRQLEGNTT